jgi:hypothetical protein
VCVDQLAETALEYYYQTLLLLKIYLHPTCFIKLQYLGSIVHAEGNTTYQVCKVHYKYSLTYQEHGEGVKINVTIENYNL